MEVAEIALKPRKGLAKKSLGRKPTLVRKPRKIKPKGISRLLREADSVFSKWVRLKYADQEGFVSCYTCGHRNHYKKMQNGHYISRFYKKYRFSESNTRVQCSMCNMWKSGDIPTFRMKLIAEGVDVESMEADYKELYKLTPEFLQETIAKYGQTASLQ